MPSKMANGLRVTPHSQLTWQNKQQTGACKHKRGIRRALQAAAACQIADHAAAAVVAKRAPETDSLAAWFAENT
jgi:hypothetical protein